MMDRLVVVVGIPPTVEKQFGTAFAKLASQQQVKPTVLSTYDPSLGYTGDYADVVYNKLVYKLKGQGSASRKSLLANTNLIVLFLQKSDGSEAVLFGKFGVEALVTPMLVPHIADMPVDTWSQREHIVNKLIGDARLAIQHARRMLRTIYEELNQRENKTCLLLPPKTFGRGFRKVQDRVWAATTRREDAKRFTGGLKTLKVPKRRNGYDYYVGQGGLVYESPSKSGPRHGLGPVWEDGHDPSCVMRGRLRFGVPYDPHFHYDCQMPPNWHRMFPGCHERLRLARHRTYANVAPNDGVR